MYSMFVQLLNRFKSQFCSHTPVKCCSHSQAQRGPRKDSTVLQITEAVSTKRTEEMRIQRAYSSLNTQCTVTRQSLGKLRALTEVHILESCHIREQIRYGAAQLHVAGQAANQHVKLVQVMTTPTLAASERRHEWHLQLTE